MTANYNFLIKMEPPCVLIVLLEFSHSCSFDTSVSAFILPQQSWVNLTKLVSPSKPKTLTLWPFTERVCWPPVLEYRVDPPSLAYMTHHDLVTIWCYAHSHKHNVPLSQGKCVSQCSHALQVRSNFHTPVFQGSLPSSHFSHAYSTVLSF